MPRLTFNAANITGHVWSTVVGTIIALGQYLAGQGAQLPDTPQAWIQFVLGGVIAVVTALAGPQRTPPTAGEIG